MANPKIIKTFYVVDTGDSGLIVYENKKDAEEAIGNWNNAVLYEVKTVKAWKRSPGLVELKIK